MAKYCSMSNETILIARAYVLISDLSNYNHKLLNRNFTNAFLLQVQL